MKTDTKLRYLGLLAAMTFSGVAVLQAQTPQTGATTTTTTTTTTDTAAPGPAPEQVTTLEK